MSGPDEERLETPTRSRPQAEAENAWIVANWLWIAVVSIFALLVLGLVVAGVGSGGGGARDAMASDLGRPVRVAGRSSRPPSHVDAASRRPTAVRGALA